MESLEAFRERARAWIEENLPEEGDETLTDQELQAHASSMAASPGSRSRRSTAAPGSRSSTRRCSSTTPCDGPPRAARRSWCRSACSAPTLLDHGSELLKQRHLPRILRGDEEWIQLLSEPSGGSDMAGAITRLTRDGDTYILNGAKMWSTGAAQAD